MLKRTLKHLLIVLSIIGLGSLIAILALNELTRAAYADRIFTNVAALPNDNQPRIAIVFGAGLERNGGPTPILYDRVATAVDLYKAGKVSQLLLTGDNRFTNYNEPEVMRQTALQLGVPDDALVLDYAGRRTYDSCYRARDIFGVTRAILVTQAFHLDRALYLCNSLGVDTIGVLADRRDYTTSSQTWWSIREAAATAEAWFDLNVTHPLPVLGEKIPIGN
jgi:vancomycin permeability regulator SanA